MKPTKYQTAPQNSNQNQFRINEQIKVNQVRVIDKEGKMLGVLPLHEAIRMAQDVNLDLIEVSPTAVPPVCKISNFGKMKYEMQKKTASAKKKQKVVEVKEIKMSFNIGKGDYDIKIKHSHEFIEKGHKVKISIRMRGREITHLDITKKMMANILKDTEEFAKAELMPKLEGMQMVTILVKK